MFQTYNSERAFRYELAHKGKFICPCCGHKTFVPYVDSKGKVLSPRVGRCDRQDRCKYHYPPKNYFEDNKIVPPPSPPIERTALPVSYINPQIVTRSMQGFRNTFLYKFFLNSFKAMGNRVDVIFSRYLAGYDPYWEGANIFWQIDRFARVRTGKIMLYGEDGKRVKDPVSHISWYHSVNNLRNFNLSQCLFGEHLIKPGGKILVVESEKTALALSMVIEGATAVACGGCGNISEKHAGALQNCEVILIPDKGKYEDWSNRASLLKGCFSVRTSSIMENAPCAEGEDIADLILKDSSQDNINKIITAI